MQITPARNRTAAAGPAVWFTGSVHLERLPDAPAPARLRGALVSFAPGARTNWHTHPLGQTLYVLTGLGLCQRRGGPVELLQPGDHVWFEPGEEHWHGAAPMMAMQHLALQEELNGSAADWLEPVSEADYAMPPERG